MSSPLQGLRVAATSRTVAELTASAEGREGFLQGLKPALAVDGALRAQLATMLSQTMKNHERISGIPETAAPRRWAMLACPPSMAPLTL